MRFERKERKPEVKNKLGLNGASLAMSNRDQLILVTSKSCKHNIGQKKKGKTRFCQKPGASLRARTQHALHTEISCFLRTFLASPSLQKEKEKRFRERQSYRVIKTRGDRRWHRSVYVPFGFPGKRADADGRAPVCVRPTLGEGKHCVPETQRFPESGKAGTRPQRIITSFKGRFIYSFMRSLRALWGHYTRKGEYNIINTYERESRKQKETIGDAVLR